MKTRILSGLIMAPLLVILIIGGYVLYAGCFVIEYRSDVPGLPYMREPKSTSKCAPKKGVGSSEQRS